MDTTPEPISGFEALGVGARSLEVLKEINFTVPTPIQEAAIPLVIAGLDVIGIAQTGTGKTLAFGLPMLDRLLTRHPGKAQEFAQGLILAPTRELALQIAETLYKVGRPQGVRIATLIGGAPMNKQVNSLRARPDIIVATPGRLEDHLHQRTMNLNAIRMVVLDEADRMLDMGFEPAIRRIMGALPEQRQNLLFSATLPKEIENLANGFLNDPQKVEIQPEAMSADLVSQELVIVAHQNKLGFLQQLLADHEGSGLIFARTRHGARKLAKSVRDMGYDAAEIHADRTLAQRRTALEGFKSGDFRFLIATDIAARGIDVKAIGIVVNFDLPDQAEDYVHRIGRTGRAGLTGRSVTLATPDQFREVRSIERTIKKEIPLSEMSPLNPNWAKYTEPEERNQRRGEKPAPRGRTTPFVKPHHRHEPMKAPAPKPNYKPAPSAIRQENVDLGPRPDTAPRFSPEARPERNFNNGNGRNFDDRNNGPRNDGPRNDSRQDSRPPFERKPFDHQPRPDGFGNPQGSDRPNNFRPGNFRSDNGPRRDFGPRNGDRSNDRPNNFRPNEDRPRYERPGNDRPYGDRPNNGPRPYGDRPFNGDRPRYERPGNDRPYGDRPYNGDRPGNDRPGYDRPTGDRPFNHRPRNDRPFNNDRPGNNDGPRNDRPYGDRPFNGNDRPNNFRSNGDRPGGDRPFNGDRPNNFRPNGDRPYNSRPYGDRPNNGPRPYGDRPFNGDRPAGDRPFNDRPYGDRPSGGDRPFRRDKPFGADKPTWKKASDKPFTPKPKFKPKADAKGPSSGGGQPPKRAGEAKAMGKFTPKKFRGPKR